VDALRTVAAVFRTSPAFDVAEGAKLDGARVVVFAVNSLRFKHQVWQRLTIYLTDPIEGRRIDRHSIDRSISGTAGGSDCHRSKAGRVISKKRSRSRLRTASSKRCIFQGKLADQFADQILFMI
jgi:hypothetical protein